jgi:hypothetical protein
VEREEALMTHSPADAAPPRHDGRRTPRRTPRAVFVADAVLLALTTAVLLDVIALPIVPRALVAVGVLVAVFALSFWSQLRCWGTLIAPSLAPSRFAAAIVGISMALLVANFPDGAGLPVRLAMVVVAPVVVVLLFAWDDAVTVGQLRERRAAEPHGRGVAPGRA